MASTNKTTNYNLSQFLGTDALQRTDYNADMLNIDNALKPTADPIQVPTGLVGKLSDWVSWITNRIKAITGKTNWYDTPTITLETANTNINNLTTNKLDKSGGTITGTIAHGRNEVQQPKLKDYSEVTATNATATGTVSLNITNGNVFNITLAGATTFTFDNPATSGQNCSFTVYLNQGATAYTVTFPASVKWSNDQIPDVSAINKTSILFFTTKNGGTRWYGSAITNLTT